MTSVELGAESVGARADHGSGRIGGWNQPHHALALASAPGLAYAVACGSAVVLAAVVATDVGLVAWLAAGVVAIILGLDFVDARPGDRLRTLRPVKRLIVTAAGGALGAATFGWLSPGELRWFGAIVMTASAVLSGAVLLSRSAEGPRSVLLVGGRTGVGQLVGQWSTCSEIELKGICLAEFVGESVQDVEGVPIVGSLDDVVAVARAIDVDEVVVVPGPLLNAHQVRRLSWVLEDASIELLVAAEFDGVVARRITPQVVGRRLILGVGPGRRSRSAKWVKGLVDRAAATILLLALSPVFVFVSILVRLSSPGPALFKQTRVGLDGKCFTIYKFRTMMVDAEARLAELKSCNEAAGPLFKMAADPRTTSVGRVLRKSSIDEVPQLLNVIKGEMSLIGPRPGLPVEARRYDEWVYRRLRVKPGMTGAWQVGGRSNLSWTESVRLDIDYVDNATLRDDVVIAMKTVSAVINSDGAV